MSDVTGYDDAIPLKSALEELFGEDEWYRLKDTRDIKTWKKSLNRALKASSVAISASVEIADDDWLIESQSILERGKEDIAHSESIRDAFSAFSACYVRLSFHQLGLVPKRNGRQGKFSAIPSNWRLNAHRSVQYTQTEKQKLWSQYCKDSRPVSDKAVDPKYLMLRRS
jgi:hypothetical protein